MGRTVPLLGLALAAGVVLGLLLAPGPASTLHLQSAFNARLSAALDLVGYVPVNVTTSNLGIHLTAGCQRLTLAALPAQTQSVASGLAGKVDVRPNAHDLMGELLRAFNITLLQARVERLAGDTYYGRLNFQQESTILSLDTRPSDAIALAVRFNGTVHVNRTLLDTSGEKVC